MADVKPEVAKGLEEVVAVLAQANIAIPIIFTTIGAVVGIIKALKGNAPPFSELEAQIQQQTALNRARGEAEIARLKALLGGQ